MATKVIDGTVVTPPRNEPPGKTRAVARHRTDTQVRADRTGMLLRAPFMLFLGIAWAVKRSRRRVLPAYWAAAELAVAWLAPRTGLSGATTALLVALVCVAAALWPARTWLVRIWRMTIAEVLGLFAFLTAENGTHAMSAHPTLTVFGPCLATAVLGWPWWYHLGRSTPEPEPPAAPVDENLTISWSQRWQNDVVAQGVCAGTRLVSASTPRAGVTDAIVRLSPGAKRGQIIRSGADVEVALDLDLGAIGWRATAKAAKLQLTIVERSYIARVLPYPGPTYRAGRFNLTTFADGTIGEWVASRPRFGVLNGLVVGSVGAGKTGVLSVLADNLLHNGWMVLIGDPQNGQSLPDWKDTASEYHDSPAAVEALIYRFHAEVMRRSQMLAGAGMGYYDVDDPRVQKLGLRPLMLIIDECHLVLRPENKKLTRVIEEAASLDRKTGCGIVLATQISQMNSLAGSIKLRDAVVSGNCWAGRLSNRGTSTGILPDSFVGDPFAIEPEIDGKTTAGMGYLRNAPQIGMLSRVPFLQQEAVAAACPHVPMVWQVGPVDPATATANATTSSATARPAVTSGGEDGESLADKIRMAFGGKPRHLSVAASPAAPAPAAPSSMSTPQWVLACLRAAPASAQALLDRPDCPVKQPRLYEVLGQLSGDGRINPPAQRGGPYTLA